MTLDLVGMGEPLIELNQTRGAEGYRPGFGGDTSNGTIAAARCGAKTGYFTALGPDVFGRSLLDLWRREGVDASRVAIDEAAHTGIFFVTHGPQGHEFSYLRAGSAASRVTPAATAHVPFGHALSSYVGSSYVGSNYVGSNYIDSSRIGSSRRVSSQVVTSYAACLAPSASHRMSRTVCLAPSVSNRPSRTVGRAPSP